eukprot:jgi/Orpsp1_1/1180477/evm.model.c7180000073573.1
MTWFEYRLSNAIGINKIDDVKSMLQNLTKDEVILELNKSSYDFYPFFRAIYKNYTEMTELLTNYFIKNKIKLELNKKSISKEYPLIRAIYNNNIEIVNLLIKYSDGINVDLELNEKDDYGYNPILWAIKKNYTEIIDLLLKYAKRRKINLVYDKNDIVNNLESIELLLNYEREKKIKNGYEREIIEINEKGENSKNILCHFNNDEIITSLIQENNNPIVKFNEKATPLAITCSNNKNTI